MATQQARKPARILSIDIGGSKVKLLASGETKPRNFPSGRELAPAKMVKDAKAAAHDWQYSAVSIGYPGRVGANGPLSEPGNLGPGWVGFDFAAAFGCPVRITNDAAMQALGSYDGGRMLFIGLGTGVGSVLIHHHALIPLELGELCYKRGRTLSSRLGKETRKKVGGKTWRSRVLDILPSLQRAFMADYLVLGGGGAKHVGEPLPPNVRLGHNLTAFRGGYRLWGIEDMPTQKTNGEHPAEAASAAEWRLL
jgi:polyphosphate glucokinase